MAVRSLILWLCAAIAVVLVGRILFLFGWRQPRLATTVRHNYREQPSVPGADWRAIRVPDATPPDSSLHNVDLRAAYNVDGAEHRSDVRVTVLGGFAPEPRTIVWIDPSRPDRATARGPGFWAMWLAFDAIIALPVLLRMH